MGAPKLEESNYDVRLCYPFMEAVINVMASQCKVESEFGKIDYKDNETEVPSGLAIVATLTGPDAIGIISICFPEEVILNLVGLMMDETFPEINAEVEDAAMEFANLIFNQAKQKLVKKNISGVRSIPIITVGKTGLRYLARGKTMVLPVTTSIGPITIEITTQSLTISDMI